MKQIAIFPIPNAVAFPGTVFPLHVFEPRYRKMIHHCVDNSLPLGVCHTEKVVSEGKPNQDIKDALNSNQSTYKPVKVFSAGPCDIVEELEDGRLVVQVFMDERYKLVKEVQTLPFIVYECEVVKDLPLPKELKQEAEQLKEKVLHRLVAMTVDTPDLQQILSSDEWQQKTPKELSYAMYQLLQMDGDVMQQILELDSEMGRLQTGLEILNQLG